MEEILRKRANRARNLALTGILVIIFVILTIIATMFTAYKSLEISIRGGPAPKLFEKPIETAGTLKDDVDELKMKIETLTLQRTDIPTVYIINTLTSSFIRIAAVALAIFITQVIVNFTRYQFRIADHFDSIADAIVFSNGDYSIFEKFVGSVSPQHIDFGKQIESPSDKLIDTVKSAIERIPKVGS